MDAHTVLFAPAVIFASLFAGAAQATLIDRGGGLIYDSLLNITWLQDANYAKSSGYDADGLMSWNAANAWAANLSYGGYDDWRLPTMLDTGAPGCRAGLANGGTDCGYNVQTVSGTTVYSEMATMYYVSLDLKADRNADGTPRSDWGIFGNGTFNGTDTNTFGQRDVGLIDNLQAYMYWSVGDISSNTGAWYFGPVDGRQSTAHKFMLFNAWAVRDGDVAAVPEPSTALLFGLGMALLGVIRWRLE